VSGAISSSTSPLRMGGDSVWGEYFSGSIDDVRVYNRALSVGEIQTDMATPVSGAPPADKQAPSVPTGLAVSGATPNSVTLKWNASTDNVGVTGYGHYLNNGLVNGTAGTSYTYTGLACGTTYSLAVDAYDAASNRSAKSTAVSASTSACSTGDTQAPTVPTNVVASSKTTTSITLSWTASTDNVGVAGYGHYKNNVLENPGGGTSYTFGGLTCNTSYTLAVDAYDAAGNRSAKSTGVSASTSACPTSGASVFMSTSGSDSNPCSQAAPCQTFNRAYHAAAPGATVEVAAGTYGGETIGADSSKTNGADVIFQPATGATVTVNSFTFQNAHMELRNMRVNDANFPRQADHITMRNVINRGVFMQGASNISIIGGEITCPSCNYHSHIENGGSDNAPPRNILFDGVYFHDWMSQGGEHVECLQILGGDGVTIRNSIFKNCGTGNGGQAATGDLHIAWLNAGGPMTQNILLENNFFYPSGNPYVIQMDDYANIDLRYNSLAGPILMFDRSGPGTGIDIVGNIMKASNCRVESSSDAVNWRYNVIQGGTCGSTDKNAAPGFIDANNNLHLASGSAALNAGDPSSYPSKDIDGQSRPMGSAPDAGADEAG
jgi:chitodextrinase